MIKGGSGRTAISSSRGGKSGESETRKAPYSNRTKAIPYVASKHGISSYSVGPYSVLSTLCVLKHVISHQKYSDGRPSAEYCSIFRRWNIFDMIDGIYLRGER